MLQMAVYSSLRCLELEPVGPWDAPAEVKEIIARQQELKRKILQVTHCIKPRYSGHYSQRDVARWEWHPATFMAFSQL